LQADEGLSGADFPNHTQTVEEIDEKKLVTKISRKQNNKGNEFPVEKQ